MNMNEKLTDFLKETNLPLTLKARDIYLKELEKLETEKSQWEEIQKQVQDTLKNVSEFQPAVAADDFQHIRTTSVDWAREMKKVCSSSLSQLEPPMFAQQLLLKENKEVYVNMLKEAVEELGDELISFLREDQKAFTFLKKWHKKHEKATIHLIAFQTIGLYQDRELYKRACAEFYPEETVEMNYVFEVINQAHSMCFNQRTGSGR